MPSRQASPRSLTVCVRCVRVAWGIQGQVGRFPERVPVVAASTFRCQVSELVRATGSAHDPQARQLINTSFGCQLDLKVAAVSFVGPNSTLAPVTVNDPVFVNTSSWLVLAKVVSEAINASSVLVLMLVPVFRFLFRGAFRRVLGGEPPPRPQVRSESNTSRR